MKFGNAILCALLAPASVVGQVVINEIHYNSEPNTSAEEFVELFNAGPDEVDVSERDVADHGVLELYCMECFLKNTPPKLRFLPRGERDAVQPLHIWKIYQNISK